MKKAIVWPRCVGKTNKLHEELMKKMAENVTATINPSKTMKVWFDESGDINTKEADILKDE